MSTERLRREEQVEIVYDTIGNLRTRISSVIMEPIVTLALSTRD